MSKEASNKRTGNKHEQHMQAFQLLVTFRKQNIKLTLYILNEKNSSASYIWCDKIWNMRTCNINPRPAYVDVYIWWEWMFLSSWKTSVCQKGTSSIFVSTAQHLHFEEIPHKVWCYLTISWMYLISTSTQIFISLILNSFKWYLQKYKIQVSLYTTHSVKKNLW
jgi:hypothetical protein